MPTASTRSLRALTDPRRERGRARRALAPRAPRPHFGCIAPSWEQLCAHGNNCSRLVGILGGGVSLEDSPSGRPLRALGAGRLHRRRRHEFGDASVTAPGLSIGTCRTREPRFARSAANTRASGKTGGVEPPSESRSSPRALPLGGARPFAPATALLAARCGRHRGAARCPCWDESRDQRIPAQIEGVAGSTAASAPLAVASYGPAGFARTGQPTTAARSSLASAPDCWPVPITISSIAA